MSEPLITVRDLWVGFKTAGGMVNALNGVSFDIRQNESVGIVGESGCGKSVTARAIMRILEKNSVMRGDICLHTQEGDINIAGLPAKSPKLREVRGSRIAMIFQEPMSSLCPVYTVGNQISEAIRLHQNVDKAYAQRMAIDYLARVGISRPEKCVDEYPYHLSGGMRQRVVIAMALSCHPALLIADEPTTALDVTVSAQILRLLADLQRDEHMAVMMINHNLGVVAQSCRRVLVMYLGRIIESADVDELFDHPCHPYAEDLLASIPKLTLARGSRLAHIKGHVPDPLNIPSGCAYHTRCRYAIRGLCDSKVPPMVEVRPNHLVQCYRYGDSSGYWEDTDGKSI